MAELSGRQWETEVDFIKPLILVTVLENRRNSSIFYDVNLHIALILNTALNIFC